MTDFATLGMRIDSTSAVSAKRNLDALPASAGRAEQAVDRLGAASARTGGQMQRLGPGIQQAGYQIGDFAVQVASGQSAVIALTQQGSQLLGAFGPWGAVLGAAGAVVGALAVGLMNAGDGAETLEDQLDDLADQVARYRDAAETAATAGVEMTESFGSMAGAARDAMGAVAALERREALRGFSAAVAEITSELESMDSAAAGSFGEAAAIIAQIETRAAGAIPSVNQMTEALLEAGRADLVSQAADIEAMAYSLGLTVGEAGGLAEGLAAIGRATGPEEQTRTMQDLLKYMTATLGPVEDMPDALAEVYRWLAKATQAGADLTGVAENVGGALSRAASEAERIADGILDAVDAAARLGQSGLSDLQRSEIQLQYRDDPIGRARAMAAAQFDARVDMGVAGNDPAFSQDLERQREAFIANAEAAARNEEALARWQEGQRAAGRATRETIDPLIRSTEAAEERIAQMRMEATLVGRSEEAQAALRRAYEVARLEADLLADAKRTGNVVTAEEAAQIERTVGAYSAAAAELDRLTLTQKAQEEAAKDAANANRELFDGFSSAIQQAESLEDALRRVGLAMIEMLARGALLEEGPFASIGGAIASAIGGGFAAGASLPTGGTLMAPPAMPQMYADGTNFHPGGLAIVGERGAELLDLPRGSRVTSNDRLQALAGGATQRIALDVEVFVDDDGKLDAIARQAGGEAGGAVAVQVTRQAMRPSNFAKTARNTRARTA